jgi:ubiquinone/menaquinone biosynthesis C-methylase UbiE
VVVERAWLINLILWLNYRGLSDAALTALIPFGPAGVLPGEAPNNAALPGRTLQIACVYGDLTARLARLASSGGGQIDVVDVVPIQLANLARKLPAAAPVRLLLRNSGDLALPDASYDRALLFFLLHEQPDDVRRRTLSEALRVVRPGGTVVVVDYARPSLWHPARYLWLPLLHLLEPFAHGLWRHDVTAWLPTAGAGLAVSRTRLFGGLYQLVRITR